MRILLVLTLLPWLCCAGETRPRSQLMDYGPFLALSLNFGSDNMTLKGLMISLNKEKTANICYDTETMRVSAAWTGGYIDYKGILFSNGTGVPAPQGKIIFGDKPGPGWSHEGSFIDPRPFKEGNLPANWARYKGLYRYGDTIVLSYTVGQTQLLESPALEILGGESLFTRTFQIPPHSEALLLKTGLPAAKISPTGNVAEITDKDRSIALIGGATAGMTFKALPDSLMLEIPPSKEPQSFKLYIGRVAKNWQAPVVNTPVPLLSSLVHTPQYPDKIVTEGQFAHQDQAYALDTITIPEENTWKSWMRLTGFDFFSDGTTAAVCTWSGDVWIVSNIDRELKSITWRRFATGLFQPMGLKIVADKIYVIGRDQITRLHDSAKIGEATHYENFNSDCPTSTNFHEFAMDLQTDSQGNFYFSKAMEYLERPSLERRALPMSGCLLKLDPRGEKLEVVASGFRALNGFAVSPQDQIFAADNEGHWIPSCPVYQIKPGSYYGFPYTAHRNPIPPNGESPICWLPRDVDNSPGGGTFVTSDQWGPFKNRYLGTSYGKCCLYMLLGDGLNETNPATIPMYGGVVKFPINFGTGIMRARFNQKDGQLYLCGMRGWDTTASRDGGFYRVRYTGKPANLAHTFSATTARVSMTFTDPLDPAAATEPGNYAVEAFNVVRTENYGSPEYSPTALKRKGRDSLTIASARLSDDNKTIFLDVPELQPVTNLNVTLNIKLPGGAKFKQQIHTTVHAIHSLVPKPGEVAIQEFSSSQPSIIAGGNCTLKWTATHATRVLIESSQFSKEEAKETLQPTGTVTVSPKSTALYKLTAEGPGGPVVSWTKVAVVKALQPDKPKTTQAGLKTQYFLLRDTQLIPKFSTLKPDSEAVTALLNFPVTAGEIANSKRSDHVGIVYSGFIEVPLDGIYKLYINSDDGSALYLHGNKLIDNDRQHNMEEASASVGLRAGKHPLRIEYFEDTGGAGLVFSYEGPGIIKQPVPAGALSH